MAGWAAKRFWTDVTLVELPGGYGIRLDARPVKTPAKAPLVVPTRGLADAIAIEWRAQQGVIDPTGMPFTRSANSAIDKVAAQRAEVVDLIAAYGDADLICYRATVPARLVARQSAAWDPLLTWAAGIGAPLQALPGVIHAPQPPPPPPRHPRPRPRQPSFRRFVTGATGRWPGAARRSPPAQ